MPKANIKMIYKNIMNFEFSSVMQKLVSTPTSNKSACMIRHIWKESERAKKQISEAYKDDIMNKFAERNESGDILVNPEDQGGFHPDPKRIDEFIKAQEDFGNTEFVFEWGPLRPSHLTDMKLSGKEIDSLGDLFNEEDGPAMPIGF